MDLLKELNNINTELLNDKDIEIEFRLGLFQNRTFNPNLPFNYFEKVFTSFKDYDNVVYSNIIYLDNNIRGIYDKKINNKNENLKYYLNIFLNQNHTFNKIYNYNKKTKIKNITSGHLRLSINKELDILNYDEKSNIHRSIDRIRFSKMIMKNLRLDLSIIYINNTYEYQVELEIIDNMKINIKDIEKIINDLSYQTLILKGIRYLQPNTLERKDLNILTQNNYSVTDKADGNRGVLVFNKQYSMMINPRKNEIIKRFNDTVFDKLTIIDGEYIEKTGKFYAFDLIYSQNEDFRDKYLDKRYNELLKYKDNKKLLKVIDFNVKKFYFDNIYKNAKNIWDNKDKLKYNLDGLIFTPVKQYYNPDNLKLPIFKWKEFHSIDIRIEYNRKEDFTYFHSHSGYKLWFNDPNIIYNRMFIFKNNLRSSKFNLGKIKGNKYFIGHKGQPLNKYKTKDDIVEVEFDINKNKWVYLRKRTHDKEKPNYYKTIVSVINAIQFNIDINTLSLLSNSSDTNEIGNLYDFTKDNTIKRKEWRLMNNQYKRSLLLETSKLITSSRKSLVDLGCGKGGDLFKWIKVGITDILGIDTSFIELFGDNGFEQRLLNNNFVYNGEYYTNGIQNIYLVWGDVSKTLNEIGYRKEDNEIIKSFINKYKKVNMISSMYAIHYLFGEIKDNKWIKSEENMKNFKNTVDTLLDKNGYLIGIFLNGDKIKKSMTFKYPKDEENKIKKTFYSIKLKKNKGFEILEIFNDVWGNDIKITEPKITFQNIKDVFNTYEIIDLKIDEGNIKLTKDEVKLIDLNYPFILQK